jgi:undecaprenyl diphosphate synthase
MSKSAIPKHVAIIMDGNGRWAQAHGEERIYGHRTGAKVVRDITTHAAEQGVRYLTLYAFSHENWHRPEDEVEGLMKLLWEYLKTEKATLLKNKIELCMIGNAHKLPLTVRTLLNSAQKATRGLSRMRLTLALSYGGQDELIRAVKQIAQKVKAGTVQPDDITPALLEDHLDTRDMPPPDLVIRTSGEQRLSNFLPWQSAYSELYFTDTTWPAFTTQDFDTALETYASRERRYGALSPAPASAAQGS